MMSMTDSPNSKRPSVVMYNNPSAKLDLMSHAPNTYYNSIGNTNHDFNNPSINGKNDENVEKNVPKTCPQEIRTYKRRFIMLFLASFCNLMNGVPQFQYTVVSDIISCFYGVSALAVDWTCIVFMAFFVPLVFPVMYFMRTKGLRNTVIVGSFLNVIGGWIQCASFSTDKFAVIVISQSVYATAELFLLSLPPFISGVWFGAREVGLACAFGVFGNQLGIATGFIFPPLTLDNNCTNVADISYGLSVIAYPIAVINSVVFIIVIFVFQEKPKCYPSIAQAEKANAPPINYMNSLKNLSKDVPFLLLFVSYGLITGTYFAMSTIMNQMVLLHFEGAEVAAGWMGAMMVFAGMAGSLVLGSVLDRTHKFKEISLATFCISFILIVIYSLLIVYDTEIWVQFLFFALIGFFTAGYLPVGFDFAAEITYPESESMSGSLLNTSCQIFSMIITFSSAKLIDEYGDFASNVFLCSCMLLGIITIGCVKCELKRSGGEKLKNKKIES